MAACQQSLCTAYPGALAYQNRDKPSLPFRCLDPQYRRELVRVYLTNVEGVCRRFCDDKKQRLLWVKDEVQKFRDFWVGLSTEQQRKLLAEKADGILKVSMGKDSG